MKKQQRKTILIVFGIILGVAVLLNLFLKDPEFSNPADGIKFAQKTNNPALAENIYLEQISRDKYNLPLHYGYVSNHFTIPAEWEVDHKTYYRNDSTIYAYYSNLSRSADSTERDLGSYLLGLCYLCENDISSAIETFNRVGNHNLKYLNNSLGNIYKKSDVNLAKYYYKKEISLKGNVSGAVYNLSNLLLRLRDLPGLKELVDNRETRQYIPLVKQREYFYLSSDVSNYSSVLGKELIHSVDTFGFLGALLIALIWLLYLRYIDVFEREKWYDIGIVFLMSCVLSYFCLFLYDVFNISLNFDLNGDWLNDLLYCISGIGLIEETIKLIPLLLFLSFSKSVNEPLDYLIYASVSAVGFAFMENILYFQSDSYGIMHGRALSSVVSHMCNSSIAAYGFIVSRYKWKVSPFIPVLIFLFLASVVHGLYDFWLINDQVKDFHFITFFILIGSVLVWNVMRNNALKNSPFFNPDIKPQSVLLSNYLFYALSGVFVFEYVLISFQYGPSAGNDQLLKSIASGTYLLIFLTGTLSHIEIKQNNPETLTPTP